MRRNKGIVSEVNRNTLDPDTKPEELRPSASPPQMSPWMPLGALSLLNTKNTPRAKLSNIMSLSSLGVATANEGLVKFMCTLKNSKEYVKFYCKYHQLPSISENTV